MLIPEREKKLLADILLRHGLKTYGSVLFCTFDVISKIMFFNIKQIIKVSNIV